MKRSKLILLVVTLSFSSGILLADLRASRNYCYLTGGYGEGVDEAISILKKFNLNYQSFDLYQRNDGKIYITLGKMKNSLFEFLKESNKIPEGFRCSRGKGYEKRYNLTADYRLFPGDERFIDSESDFLNIFKNQNKVDNSYAPTIRDLIASANTPAAVSKKAGNDKSQQIPAKKEAIASNSANKPKNLDDKLAPTPIKDLDINDFKLMHPSWYSEPTSFVENQFSTSACSVIRGGDFDNARKNAMNSARKDINIFLGSGEGVDSSNSKQYLNELQAGIYMSQSEQVYVNNLPFYCVLASISYSNIKKIQESQLSISKSAEMIKSELIILVDKKIELAARGVLAGSKDFRDIFRNFNSYIDYGDYKLADEMFYKFIGLNTEIFDAHKEFIFKLQAYKSKDEIQEIYRVLQEEYPLNQSIQLAYASTLSKIEYLLSLRDMVAQEVAFLPAYYEFLKEADLEQTSHFVPSMKHSRQIAQSKVLEVGVFNFQRYYPFTTNDVRKRFEWMPAAAEAMIKANASTPVNAPLVSQAYSAGGGKMSLMFSDYAMSMYGFKIEYSIDGGPYIDFDQGTNEKSKKSYGVFDSTIRQYEDQKKDLQDKLDSGSYLTQDDLRKIESLKREIEATKKQLNDELSKATCSDGPKQNGSQKQHMCWFEVKQFSQRIEYLERDVKSTTDRRKDSYIEGIESAQSMIDQWKKAGSAQEATMPSCPQPIKNLVTQESICRNPMKGYLVDINDKLEHRIDLRITDVYNEVTFKSGKFKASY